MVFPSQPDERVATLDDIYVLFDTYLGRTPDYVSEALPRVGHTYLSQMAQIRCSQEAANYRANHGVEPDSWCFTRDPVTGAPIPGVQPPPRPPAPPPPPPPPSSGIPGIDALIARIWEPIQAILAKVNAIRDGLGERIAETLGPLLREISEAGGRITQTLADNITALIPRALELAAEAADQASEVARGFLENAASVGDVAGGFIDAVAGEKLGLLGFGAELGQRMFGDMVKEAIVKLELDHAGNTDSIIDALHKSGMLPSSLSDALSLVPGRTTPLHLIVGTALLIGAAASFAGAIFQPYITRLTHHQNAQLPENLIAPNDAAQLVARELRDYPAMRSIALQAGFNEDQFRMIADLAFRFAPPEQIIAARQRGYIDVQTEDRYLNRHGFDAEQRELLRNVAVGVAGPQDEVRFMHRDVYEPAIRDRFRLLEDFPEQFAVQMAKLGFPRDVAERYYMAGWEIPSPNQLFEMLHRGEITEDDVRAGLKAADVLPMFRDAFIRIAYNTLTRVDIRRIHDMLGKDHAWLVRQHRLIGYDAENAELLSQFVETLNDDERTTRRKELTGPLVTRIISGVVSGTLNDEQATSFFARLGYGSEATQTFLTEAALIRNEQRTERIGNLLGDLYVKGRRTRIEAADQMRERGFTPGEIEERFRAWDLEKELRAPTEREEKERDLTRADIVAMYRARQIERTLAHPMLVKLRYSAEEANAILDLADFQEKAQEDKDRVEVVHRKFVKGAYDKTVASAELGRIGLRQTQIDASIARWELEISARTADLSVGQVGDLYVSGFWDDPKTKAYLMRIGYDEDESSGLLALWGSKVEKQRRADAEKARKAEEARQREAQRVLDIARRADKQLSAAQLLNAGAAGVLDWSTVRAEIVAKGYTVQEADTLIRTKQQQGVKRNA